MGQINYGPKEDVINLNYSNPKEYEISEISVEGAEFLDRNALISLSGLSVGDRIKLPGDATTTALKKLWNQGIIGDIQIFALPVEGDKIKLTIKLTERPRLSKYILDGITKGQVTSVSEQIDLIRGRIVTDAMKKNTEIVVKDYFVEKGFLNTSVKVSLEKDTTLNNYVKMFIDVDKNRKVNIDRVHFIGNEAFADTRLKKKLKSTKERVRVSLFEDAFRRLFRLKPMSVIEPVVKNEVTKKGIISYLNKNVKLNFFNGSKFIIDDYNDDKKALIDFYNSKGYRDATIISDSIYNYGDRSIRIDLKIDEGNRYYFRDIIWTGNYIHSEKVLNSVLGVNKGDVYNMDMINKRLNFNPTGPDISALYMDDGYLFFNVNPVEIRVDQDSIDVEMRMYEGTQATINKIMINGNDQTNDHVILREILTQPGEKFRRSDIIKTNQRLSQLGYFDPENIDIRPIPNPADGTVDIEYNLSEQSNDQIELSGGWGGSFGFVGTLGLILNNFSLKSVPDLSSWKPIPRGDGQKLAIRFQANGRRYQNYSVTFSEPWLGGKKPNSLSVSISRSLQRSFADFASTQEISSIKLVNGTIGLGRRVRWPDDFFQISNSISFTNYDVSTDPTYFSNGFLGLQNGSANSITFNTNIARNSVDSPTFPKSGSNISLNVALTPPYSLFRNNDKLSDEASQRWIEYHKWVFDASYYTKLAGNLVLATSAHFGYLGTYNENQTLGAFERFQMGGSGLAGQASGLIGTDIIGLRGYDDNEIPGNINSSRGGTVFNKYVMELRYPISLNPSSTIYILGFAEAGNAWRSDVDFSPFNSFKTVGIGARIFMPAFGLIGIDWGRALDTTINGITPAQQVFQFRIGQQIR